MRKSKTGTSNQKIKRVSSQNLISVEYIDDNPDIGKIPEGKLIVVGVKNKYAKWAYMKCPSGCGEIIMLSLQKNDIPSWKLKVSKKNLPTLSPSIWKLDGCKSHFLLRKGEIINVRNLHHLLSLPKNS